MSDGIVRFRGTIAGLAPEALRALLERQLPDPAPVRAAVSRLIDAVRSRGDQAVRELTLEFDRISLVDLEVPQASWRAALHRLAAPVRTALERAARNIERAHRAWLPIGAVVETEPGITLERRAFPLARVGVYAPGGRAIYPSSVLMGAVPAKVAGVGEVVICSPAGPDGIPADPILAAAELARADRVFAIGGVQAIAAMAFGTESVPRVDRIVGPGNAYVMEAKLQLADRVSIDSPAGPSEILIIADSTTPAELVARELVAQAEHDPRAVAVAVMLGAPAVAEPVERALRDLARRSPRAEIVGAALGALGAVLSVPDLEEAIRFANALAPEHLLLACDSAAEARDRFQVAGAVFVGAASSVVFGDYLTGANHVLPTAGLARSYSGLGPGDFVRWTTYQTITKASARRLGHDTAVLATAEGLPGHAAAARFWEEESP
ncbi:MAG: histidinol dehydrogenase [Gemmatimonadota bacterium]